MEAGRLEHLRSSSGHCKSAGEPADPSRCAASISASRVRPGTHPMRTWELVEPCILGGPWDGLARPFSYPRSVSRVHARPQDGGLFVALATPLWSSLGFACLLLVTTLPFARGTMWMHSVLHSGHAARRSILSSAPAFCSFEVLIFLLVIPSCDSLG